MRRLMSIFSVAALSGLLLAGCASVAHVEKDQTVDLNNYRSFAWVETTATRMTPQEQRSLISPNG